MPEYQVVTAHEPIGSLVRRLREALGLTQEELAEHAGVSARTISDIERGLRKSVYKATAARLGAALRLDSEELMRFQAIARGMTPSARSAPGSLPPPTMPLERTRLIGRDDELGLILRGLANPSIAILTVTGPGGIGKTRLAVETARRAQSLFEDGIYFISLAPLDHPELVAPTVGRSVGLPPLEEPTAQAIARHLESKSVLLVLDTFEHVVDSAPVVGEIVMLAGRAKALITSREPLRVRGEHIVPLATLRVPRPGLSEMDLSPAVELFLERARAARPDLRIDAEALATIEKICRRIDGLPLAIELAAARIRHLALRDLYDHLTQQLSILTGGSRDLPQRQRTMRDTIAWSYELLGPHEQRLFRAVSVFAGGWTLDARNVWQESNDQEALDTLSALVDKSLILVIDEDTTARYSMLDVILEFARDLACGADELSALARRHCDHFVGLAERAEPEFRRDQSDLWFIRISGEHDNLRRALRFALAEGEPDLAARLAGALWQFWRARGHYTEGRGWIRQALALAGATPSARAKALWGAAWLALHQADLDEATRWSEELRSIADGLRDPRVDRHALTVRGMIELSRGQVDAAIPPLEESVELCEDLGDEWLLATSKLNLALALVHAERPLDASHLLSQARPIYLSIGDQRLARRIAGHRC